MDTRFALTVLIASGLLVSSAEASHRGVQYIGFTNFQTFEVETNADGLILHSPEIRPDVNWTELIPSWNYSSTNALRLEAQVRFPDHLTKWFSFGDWSRNTNSFPRQSIKNQQDADGNVLTDTLQMKKSGGAVRLRLTLRSARTLAGLQLLGLCLSEKSEPQTPLPPNQQAWGQILRVPERSQAVSAWCSPTAVSMILALWSRELNRPELNYDVPVVARAVDDPAWPGTGNWAFNVAFAGGHPAVRAYVTRFTDLNELESWVPKACP